MIDSKERKLISNAHSIGPKVVSWLEQAGYEKLADFVDETPENVGFRVEIATGIGRNKNAFSAYANLIAYAKQHVFNSQ